MQQKIRNKFQELFSTKGSVYASPGRINLIGEHTDYNGGFVFPGAIDKGMIAEIKPNGTGKVRAFSVDLNDYAEFGLNEEDAPKASWAKIYFRCLPRNHQTWRTDPGIQIPCLQARYLWVQACPPSAALERYLCICFKRLVLPEHRQI